MFIVAVSIVGSMVEFSPPTRVTRVRFPDDADILSTFEKASRDLKSRAGMDDLYIGQVASLLWTLSLVSYHLYKGPFQFDSVFFILIMFHASIVGSVVEFSPATREARVRFPDDATLLLSFEITSKHNLDGY